MTGDVDVQLLVSALAGAAIAIVVFRKWLWRVARLVGRTALGGAALALLSLCAGSTGPALGVDLVNALVLGVLGLPGLGLLWALLLLTA